jgi:hypothetical protein
MDRAQIYPTLATSLSKRVFGPAVIEKFGQVWTPSHQPIDYRARYASLTMARARLSRRSRQKLERSRCATRFA